MRRIVREIEKRPSAKQVEGFRSLLNIYSPSCVVADSMERSGVMNSTIRAVNHNHRIVGPALTVKLFPGDLVDCLDALSVAKAGDVIVVDACSETETSIWGGLMASLCRQKGVVAAIIDGAVRDIDEVLKIGFPLFARAVTPRSTHSPFSHRTEPIEVNTVITCGGIIVEPGDIVLADEIGIVVIPQREADKVLILAQEQAEKEQMTRKRISEGKTVEELLEEFGRL